MKKLTLIILLLMPALASAESLADYQTLELELTESLQVEILDGSIDFLRAYLYLYPKEDAQYKILQTTAVPKAHADSDALLYIWNEPRDQMLNFSLKSKLTSSSNSPKIKKKIQFPTVVPDELKIYTRTTAHIDSNNPAIRAQASEIAEGENDVFIVLFKLGSWVEHNVEYDLSTLTADVSQKASWVLQNRIGVCDEMTSLFIAMARSLGIPSRFVTGVSHTNHPAFDTEWQAHGWAEAYIPTIGWVPFDPAFKQFGYVDATHIKLGDSFDPEQTATKFEWGGSADISPDNLHFDVDVSKKGIKNTPRIELYTEPLRDELAFGSYNVIKTKVKNNLDQYTTAALFLSMPAELAAEQKKQHIFLKPHEEKNVLWLVNIADELDGRYTYTLPITISSEQNITTYVAFTAKEQGTFISKQQAEMLMYEGEEKKFTPNVVVNCSITPVVLANETIDVDCTIHNKGNTVLDDLSICSDTCKTLMLYISDEKKANFSFSGTKVGKFEHIIQMHSGELTKRLYLPYEVLDKPTVIIKDITIPESISFEENFRLEFALDKHSYALPQQIVVDVDGGNINEVFQLANISYVHSFSISSQARYLHEGKNNITISARWQDVWGNSYTEQTGVPITLTQLTFTEKIENLFLRLGLWFKNG